MASRALTPIVENPLKSFFTAQFLTKCTPPTQSTNLSGLTAVITGSNSGIGLATARVMLQYHLSHLIMAVRSVNKGEEVADTLRKDYPKAKIEVWPLEMLAYDSIQAFVQRCNALPRLDMAILNAGIGNAVFTINKSTGHEETFQVNYLSTALLAILLLPVLKSNKQADKPARMLIVASGLAFAAKFPNHAANPLIPSFDDATGWGTAAAMERYSVTKLMVLMLVEKLAEIVSPKDIIVDAVEPGLTGGSNLNRQTKGVIKYFFKAMKAAAARTPEQAAWTYVDAVAVRGEEAHGGLVLNWKIYP